MTTTRKYYMLIPAEFVFEGVARWQELLDVKTLTAAQHYVDEVFGGHPEPEIGLSINGGAVEVISKKNEYGKWEVYYECNSDELYANDQIQYHLNGKLVSREDFYKYGFRHEKNNYQTTCCAGR